MSVLPSSIQILLEKKKAKDNQAYWFFKTHEEEFEAGMQPARIT